MSAFAYDQTIRVPKLPTGPVRRLPQHFAPARARRWPWLAALAALVAVAIALALAFGVGEHAERSAQAAELLRLLGR